MLINNSSGVTLFVLPKKQVCLNINGYKSIHRSKKSRTIKIMEKAEPMEGTI